MSDHKGTWSIWLALAVLALSPPASALAASVYVKSMKAKVLASPKFDSAKVAEVDRGQELGLVGKTDRWMKVKVAGKEGWIPELLVSVEPSKTGASVLGSGSEDISGKARRRASAIATAGASRGLTAEGLKEMQAADPKADYAALARVQAQTVDRAEARDYLRLAASGGKEVAK